MSIILTCGHEFSGYKAVHEILKSAGLKEALPSSQGGLSPEEIGENICEAHEIDENNSEHLKQIQPSKLWQNLTTDLLLSNLKRKDWGWADSKTIYLLDHWAEYDPRIKFILAYCSPSQALAHMMADKDFDAKQIKVALTKWQSYNKELLKFYNQNRDRCILVNSSVTLKDPAFFVDFVRKAFAVELSDVNEVKPELKNELAIPAILSSMMVEDGSDAELLFEEMESSTNLPMDLDDVDKSVLIDDAWKQYQDLLKDSAALKVTKEKLAELEAKKAEQETSLVSQDNLNAQKKLTQENELLLLQLNQVQEELEHLFIQQQSQTKAQPTVPEKASEPFGQTHKTIDMRHFIDGENWWHAEADGRWAGPNKTSSIKLPLLAKGTYQLRIKVVDAIHADILREMKLSLNGRTLHWKGLKFTGNASSIIGLSKRKLRYPQELVAQFSIETTEADKSQNLELTFPKVISPAELNSDENDQRQLAIRIQQFVIKKV